MPRRSADRPWLHSRSGFWCATVEGRRVYLDHDYKVACRKLTALLKEAKQRAAGKLEWLDRSFAELVDLFLDHVEQTRKPTTFTGYKARLTRALTVLGTRVRIGEMGKRHLAQIEAAMPNSLSPTTVRDTLTTVQTVFGWALKNEIVEVNPLAGYAKPAARVRTRIISDKEFQDLLRAADRNPAFRRVLLALRLTGCRPGEIRKLTWDMVDLDQGLWVFPDHKSITRQRRPRPRVVPLPGVIWKLCRRLAARRPSGSASVFLNMLGKPYSKDCLVKIFTRLRHRAHIGVKAGERIVLYSNRHTFATECAGRVADIELAELLGHTTTQMIPRYTHFNVERLREIRRRAESAPLSWGKCFRTTRPLPRRREDATDCPSDAAGDSAHSCSTASTTDNGTLIVAPYRPADGIRNAPGSLPLSTNARTRSGLTLQRSASCPRVRAVD